MINLIKNELIKIFSKKSMYIMLLITLAFALLINITTKNAKEYYDSYEFDSYHMSYLNDELKNAQDRNDMDYYASIKTDIDLSNLSAKYDNRSWQKVIIESDFRDIIYNLNYNTYSFNKDDAELIKYQELYDKYIREIESGNWQSFVNIKIVSLKESVTQIKKVISLSDNKDEIESLDNQLKNTELELEVLNYRIDKDISYAKSKLNDALSQYHNCASQLINENNIQYGGWEQDDYELKKQHNYVLECTNINKYMVENKIEIDDNKSSYAMFKGFVGNYEVFIIIIVIMIAGAIVSEEHSKGTIKLLLIRPYSRTKILLSKYITTLIMIVFALVSVLLIQFIVGGIVFGFSSLSWPVILYNFNSNTIVTYNVFNYIGITFIAMLPYILIITTLAFAISTIFTNTALATTLAILGLFTSQIINQLAIYKDIEVLKYFVTLNWNFNQFLWGRLPEFKYLTFEFSIVVCITYFILLIIPAFIVFKKKNIKNI